MKKPIPSLSCLLLFVFPYFVFAQSTQATDSEPSIACSIQENNEGNPCISPLEYEILEKRCAKNAALLGLSSAGPQNEMITLLSWPLRSANGLNDCNFYGIGAYVDQNTTAGVFSDYNCGTKTYDSHRGTDISIWPFPFYKMDNNQVEVIAAAAGTIVDKADGNFDKNCGSNNLMANYLVIQHADGSRVLYFHMKKNSLTTKAIGQSVALGEYLGVVGSSGNSSGPHLHFEVWAGSTVSTRVDPYSGPCNVLNANSWWLAQKPYAGPEILKTSVHTTDATLPACPETETPYEAKCFSIPFQGPGLPAGFAKFYIFMRYETAGMNVTLNILNPNGSVFNTWTYTSTNSFNASLKSWSKTLPTLAGTYTFQSILNGITCSTTFDIVNAAITADGPTTFCQGGSVQLNASSASNYLWSNGATTQSINVNSSGSYSVTETSASGCSSASPAIQVSVNPTPPVPTITASGPTNFCQGNSVMLTASTANSYLWSNAATTKTITVASSGNYVVTITNQAGCSANSVATSVTVNPLPNVPVITANGPTTFCQGNSVMLTANQANSYLWNNGATTQAISVSNAGSYAVTVANASGCTASSAQTSVTVNPLPPVPLILANGPTTFCQGNSVMLTASQANSYLWNNGATTQAISVSNAGSYAVTVANASGCTASSAQTSVTVNPLPPVPLILANGPTTFCQGNSVMLTASQANSYIWNNGATTQAISVSNAGNYTVTVANASGCTAISTQISVIVNPLPPVPVISANGPVTFCQGSSVILTATMANNYLWNNGATTQAITVSSAGSYGVTVSSASGCSASSSQTLVTVNALPPIPTIIANGPLLTSSASIGNQWYLDGNPISGAVLQTLTATQNGNYTVKVTNANGCSSISAIFMFVNTGTETLFEGSAVMSIPNPNNGIFRLEIVGGKNQTPDFNLEIYNLIGEKVFESRPYRLADNIDISAQPNGIYFIRMTSNAGKRVMKAIKN